MSDAATLDVQDLINAAIKSEPVSFKAAFDSVIADKVYNAIESRKMEMAKSIFNTEVDNSQEGVTAEDSASTEEEQNGEDA